MDKKEKDRLTNVLESRTKKENKQEIKSKEEKPELPNKLDIDKLKRNRQIHKKTKPTISATLLCIIYRENKSCKLLHVSYDKKMFSFEGHTYFLISDGIYLTKNKMLVTTFMEGISTPLCHTNVETEEKIVEYIDHKGTKQTMKLKTIKGLKYDSEIIDILLNRNLAEKFTKIKVDNIQYLIALLVIVSIVLSGIGIAIHYI